MSKHWKNIIGAAVAREEAGGLMGLRTDGLFLEEVHCDAHSVQGMDRYEQRIPTRTEITLTCIGEVPHELIDLHGERICILPVDDWKMVPRAELAKAQERIGVLERQAQRLIAALNERHGNSVRRRVG